MVKELKDSESPEGDLLLRKPGRSVLQGISSLRAACPLLCARRAVFVKCEGRKQIATSNPGDFRRRAVIGPESAVDPSVDGSSRRDLPHGLYEGRGGGGGAADVTPSLQNTQITSMIDEDM
ncbi:hypothetical protein G5714_013530 [Onychostoma macrolepis]|uniref:Uncharacterized protein n=1 Tax=Onychostoma macrolepis TaxID=369639 RepID=A0A7J6CEX9_9TELE|nr:hypothetical protein G5714_013530 [Onychostoma macrolepis]